jgi:hypothetical protein
MGLLTKKVKIAEDGEVFAEEDGELLVVVVDESFHSVFESNAVKVDQ